jgi:hypothetical protein
MTCTLALLRDVKNVEINALGELGAAPVVVAKRRALGVARLRAATNVGLVVGVGVTAALGAVRRAPPD